MIAVVSQGTQESREAARRVMARIPGAVEIAPGSWRHRITHAEPSQKHSTGGRVMGANSSEGNAVVGKDSKSAKNRVVGISAGESQQQLVMFSEVSHVG